MVAAQDTNDTDNDSTDSNTDSETSDDDPIDVAIEVAAELSCDLLTEGVGTGTLPDYISDNHPITGTVWAVHPTLPASEREDSETQPPRNAQSFLVNPPEIDDTNDTPNTDTPTISVEEQFLDDYHTERLLLDTPKPWNITDNNLAADENAESYLVGTDWDDDEYAVAVTPNAVIKSLEWEEHHHTFDDGRSAWVLDATGLDRLREIATDAGYNWQNTLEPEEPSTTEPDNGDRYILSDDEKDALDRATQTLTEGDEIAIRYEKKNGNGIGEKEGVVETVNTGNEEDDYGYNPTQGIVIRREDGRCNKIRRDEDNDDTPCVYSNSQYPFMGELLTISFIPTDSGVIEPIE